MRGPAWRIGDIGRRLERCLVVLDSVQAALGPAGPAEVEAASIESLLAANESLVTYRRRHRSDVERAAAVALLVSDEHNPRSLASCIDRLSRHADRSDWQEGRDLAERAGAALTLPLDELIPTVRAVVDEAGTAIVARWFSAPVSAIVMHATAQQDGDR